MEKAKVWIKYIAYFIIGFLILITFSSMTQIRTLNELDADVNTVSIILKTIKSSIVLYTILYFLILTLNLLYNVMLIKKLNEESEKIRKVSDEKILKERGKIDMLKKTLITLIIIIVSALSIFYINFARKIIIIDRYVKTVSERASQRNAYWKMRAVSGGNINFYENIQKGTITINKGESISNYEPKHMIYTSNKESWLLTDSESNGKYASKSDLSEEELENLTESNGYGGGDGMFSSAHNLLDKIRLALETRITTKTLNGKKCYAFYREDIYPYTVFIEKKDLVAVRIVESGGYESDLIEYSFGTVTDEDVKMPNLEEYIVLEN